MHTGVIGNAEDFYKRVIKLIRVAMSLNIHRFNGLSRPLTRDFH